MSNQTELWKPVIERFPEVTSKAMLKLLKQANKIGMDQLKEKINAMFMLQFREIIQRP